MDLTALNRALDGGAARCALAQALALLPEQAGSERPQMAG